ncbi:hypothetical protein FRC00_004739 [Tulasnella sp. 408]|nr:hypothetical protein FRC00_004739 [Tulasnella sp. 408]
MSGYVAPEIWAGGPTSLEGDTYAYGALALKSLPRESMASAVFSQQLPTAESHQIEEDHPLYQFMCWCCKYNFWDRPFIDEAVKRFASIGSQTTVPSPIPGATSEDDSLVQPGRHVPERDLPSELSGCLTKIRELDGSVTKKTADKTDGGTYSDVFEGELDEDGCKIAVAIKSIRRFEGTEEKRFNMLCDAARGLAHLHSLEPVIIHGDINPEDVLVMDNLDGALCDFGVSRLFVGIGKASGLTTTGNRTGGRAGYQAKELLEETAPSASIAGDVYAFGGLILAAAILQSLNDFVISPSALIFGQLPPVAIGSSSDVHRATLSLHGLEGTPVAVKKLRLTQDPVRRNQVYLRMLRQLRIWVQLRHNGILPLLGFHIDDIRSEAWLISPWQPGGNLLSYLSKHETRIVNRLALCVQIGKAVRYLHEQIPPVFHGDLKASHVLVTTSGTTMLTGFGLAEALEDLRSGLTTSGGLKTSIRWTSPELFTETVPRRSHHSDVWAFGCLLLEHQVYVDFSSGAGAESLRTVRQFMNVWMLCRMLSSLYKDSQGIADSQHDIDLPLDDGVLVPIANCSLGRFSDIYKAIWQRPNKLAVEVAVKMLIQRVDGTKDLTVAEAKERWYREGERWARMWNSVKHRCILPLFAFAAKPPPYVLTPWCENGDLKSYLRTNPSLDLPRKMDMLIQVGKGILALHNHQPAVIHGNVHVTNILVHATAQVYLAGFSQARYLDEPDQHTSSGLTTGANEFSPSYVIPEVANESPLTAATDVYSFACLILECLSGNPPFYKLARNVAVLKMLLDNELPAFADHSELPDSDPLWPILRKAWNVDPSERPTMPEILAVLQERVGHNAESTTPLRPPSIVTSPAYTDSSSLIGSPADHSGQEPMDVGQLEGTIVVNDDSPMFRGGFSDVYRGEWTVNGKTRIVAVKSFRAAALNPNESDQDNLVMQKRIEARIRREALIWSNLRHPQVVPFFGIKLEDRPLLASKWYENGNLGDYIKAHPEVPLVVQTGQALAYLHGRTPPICHGDLKPNNVLLNESMLVGLADFGLSQLVVDAPHVVDPGIGTKGYQAPELVRGSPKTLASDVYAFASFTLSSYAELPGRLIPAFTTPADVAPPQIAREVERGSWKRDKLPDKLLPTLWDRIQAADDLDPSFVLKPYGYRFAEGPCLVVPRVDGGNIFQYLYDAARAIAHLHGRSPPIVHGRIHPTEIVVNDQGHAILFDFGIGHAIANLETQPTQATSVTNVLPDGGYYGPEVLRAEELTPGADVYAFAGVILVVMSGRHPHNDHKVSIAAWMDGKPDPKDHPALPPDNPLWELMNKMWAESPTERPTMLDVSQHLEYLLKTSGFDLALPIQLVGHVDNDADDQSQSGDEQSPRLKALVDEAIRILDLSKVGTVFSFSELLKRLDQELAPELEGELEDLDPEAGRGTFSFVSQCMWTIRHPNGAVSRTLVAVKTLRIGSLTGSTMEKEARIELALQVGRGLEYLHSRTPPVGHGDIKPRNVVITVALIAKICDFGLSRVIQDHPTGYTTGSEVGTEGYHPFEGSRKIVIMAATLGKCQVSPPETHGVQPDDPVYRYMCWCCQALPADRPSIEEAVQHRSQACIVTMYIPYKELSKGSEIGAGTFGDVFRGTWQRATGMVDVAIKVLKERDIPPTYTENQVRERMDKSLGVALGLEYLHTCPDPGPIFHGDIKPTNILLKDEFTPQLCDFGLAKVLSDKPTGYSTSGRVAGSAHFESFEMWREGICSLEGDIFSFGGTLLLVS